ncbi:MAG: chromosomal replication initiator protein DnaA, partial [Chlamydiales bacterium]|nr:chromosomal replication initiator protein DnaA [Chlamydiales bacterium]
MLTRTPQEAWSQFLDFIAEKCSATEFQNWFASIRFIEGFADSISLEVPNIFVQEYLLSNYKKDLSAFLPTKSSGEPAIQFILAESKKKVLVSSAPEPQMQVHEPSSPSHHELKLNPQYTFQNFI